MTLMFGFENAIMVVWCSWNMISPEKEKLIGQDLFKYEGAKD